VIVFWLLAKGVPYFAVVVSYDLEPTLEVRTKFGGFQTVVEVFVVLLALALLLALGNAVTDLGQFEFVQ